LAAAIRQKLGVDAELIPSSGGVFDVVVDGRRIYCKRETGRFPTHDEVLAKLS
jgi:selenoprotein W-related protein